MAKSLPHNLIEIRRDWAGLSAYERFEAFVALILTLLIAAVIAVALWRPWSSTIRSSMSSAVTGDHSGEGRDPDRGAGLGPPRSSSPTCRPWPRMLWPRKRA